MLRNKLLAIISTLALLSGCQSMADEATIGIAGRVVSADSSVQILNASLNGSGVSGSGGDECCMSIPAKWKPGMTATLSWTKDPSPGVNPDGKRRPALPNGITTPEWKRWMNSHEANYKKMEKIIPLPKYGETCGVTFVFLPCDDARVILDCDERYKLFRTLPGGKDRYPELIRRMGGRAICQ
ncbi:DUF3304 domain-containing protein [Aquitalea denitrificans]|uniref:DUF3304 domain-containing protein n=1 Tax=Aquitalea denitrificans TaxID=519081 RepID=UPI0013569B8C|nr:DUF3304 domain-containing protein [Aquitalea denitrificans]